MCASERIVPLDSVIFRMRLRQGALQNRSALPSCYHLMSLSISQQASCTSDCCTQHQPATLSADPVRRDQLVDLLVLVTSGDRVSFERLYRLASPNLYLQLTRILKRDSWADEVLQEVFVKIWIHAGEYRTQCASPMSWMSSIARNAALDRLGLRDTRECELNTELAEAIVDPDPGPLQNCVRKSDAHRVNRCMDQLPAHLRQPISLAFYQGLTHREIAVNLAQPLGTVKTQIRRALTLLKNCVA